MKKGLVLLIVLALVATATWIILSGRHQEHRASQEASTGSSTAAHSALQGPIVADSEADGLEKSEAQNPVEARIKPQESYKEQTKAISDLVARLPQSKPMLLKMIETEDLFKGPNIQVQEHSIDEITQNQLGAIKVMALRALIKAESDPYKVKQDIDHIIQTAKDPTIVKIAQAARDSIDQGRHFFNDFLSGVDQMPLKN